ncbi:MAG TPA: hypothetical protein VM658_19740 [bacterium]|nr:hypothetical protein [bacterium]
MSVRTIEVKFKSALELESAYKEHIRKGGIFIPSDDPAPRTTPVEIKFLLPGVSDPIVVAGEVAYAATKSAPMPGMGTGMAIQFNKITPQTMKIFEASITIARAEGLEAAPAAAAPQPAAPDQGAAPDQEAVALGGDDEELEWDGDGENEEALEKEAEPDEASIQKLLARMSQMSAENLYALIRKLPLHEKVTAAKRGNRTVRNILLQEGNKKIMGFLLQNPQMSTGEVIQMLKLTNLSQEVVQAIAKNSSWSQSEEVKFGLVTHPKTPLPLALSLLTLLNQNSLAKLAKSANTKHQMKSKALQLLEQRRKSG